MKRFLIIALVMLAALGSVSAKTISTTEGAVAAGSTSTTYSLNFDYIYKAVDLIVGIFAGGYVLVKAAVDIFHAVRNSSEDPNGLKKAIGGLVLNIAILSSFYFVLNYVFASLTQATVNLSSDSATDAFFGALTGALVEI